MRRTGTLALGRPSQGPATSCYSPLSGFARPSFPDVGFVLGSFLGPGPLL